MCLCAGGSGEASDVAAGAGRRHHHHAKCNSRSRPTLVSECLFVATTEQSAKEGFLPRGGWR